MSIHPSMADEAYHHYVNDIARIRADYGRHIDTIMIVSAFHGWNEHDPMGVTYTDYIAVFCLDDTLRAQLLELIQNERIMDMIKRK